MVPPLDLKKVGSGFLWTISVREIKVFKGALEGGGGAAGASNFRKLKKIPGKWGKRGRRKG